MLPSSYNPTTSNMFIGPARAAALHLDKLSKLLLQGRDPYRLIFSGPPGIGKSRLTNYLLERLGASKWNTTKLNGTQVKIDEVEDVARQFQYRDLLGAYRFLWVEEIDKTPPVARSRLLTLCDDLPEGWALVATTNITPEAFKAMHEATKTRYSFLEIGAPTADEIYTLIQSNWPVIPECEVRRIATFACGCVREALNEANNYFIAAAA